MKAGSGIERSRGSHTAGAAGPGRREAGATSFTSDSAWKSAPPTGLRSERLVHELGRVHVLGRLHDSERVLRVHRGLAVELATVRLVILFPDRQLAHGRVHRESEERL